MDNGWIFPIATGAIAALLLVLFSQGFDKWWRDHSAPHWEDVCTSETTETVLSTAPIGTDVGGGLYLVTTSECIKYEKQCVWGADYAGLKECEAAHD